MNGFLVYGSVVTGVYFSALALFVVRRKSPFILRRSPLMLSLSLVGNLVLSLVFLSQVEEIEKDIGIKVLEDCRFFFRVRQALGIIFSYILYFPYLLRIYRLFLIFKAEKHWDDNFYNYSEYAYRTKQIWMLKVFVLVMLPFIAMASLVLYSCKIGEYLPASESEGHKFYSDSLYLIISFIQALICILSIYWLRDISDDFKMTRELMAVSLLWVVTPTFTIFPPVDLKKYKSLPGLLRNAVLFLVSAVYPIVCSILYKRNEEVITVEMLESLESVLMSKTPLNEFEDFLREFDSKANESHHDASGFQLLQVYMKCEYYISSSSACELKELIEEILDIGIPINYVNTDKDSIKNHLEKVNQSILSILSEEYFSVFKKSWRFKELKRQVNRQEIFTGRLMRIGLTKTVSSLV